MKIFYDAYEKYIKMAIDELKEKKYSQAEENIKHAMLENPHSPDVHNLYGILEELQLDGDLARKHYRAACALDSTYKPAMRNLERIGTFKYCFNKGKIDYGDKPKSVEESLYTVMYDKNHVGHLIKNK
jgi:hypothetical protein